jgi:AraC-like DNA-binding protein
MLSDGSVISYVASDPLEAEHYMTHTFCSHRLEALSSRRVGMRHMGLSMPGSAFNSLEYGTDIEVRSDGFDRFYMLEMPLTGGVEITYGADDIRSSPGKALLLSPGPRFRSRWHANTRQWMLQIEAERMEERFVRLTHRNVSEMPVFNPVVDLRTRHGRQLVSMFNSLARDFAVPEQADIVRRDALTNRIVDLIIGNIPFVKGGAVVPQRVTATPRHVKRALELFHARFAERLSIPDIAAEMGVSERTLYEGFQQFYQTTPYDMLTRIRMENARSLIKSYGVTVAEAASQSGFRHLGRFSSAYRDFFGVLPSVDAANRH